MDFVGFPKIPRLFRDIVITEKIDGTNAQIVIIDSPMAPGDNRPTILAASRSRYITKENDNHGFARWVDENQDDLRKLGFGHHFGEWWGQGIQRNYGLKEKRFSLFNVSKWSDANVRPLCCHVVPVLWTGGFDMAYVRATLEDLKRNGSKAAPGFMKPEGVVVFHTRGNNLFKATIENDETGKE
jgi:hypothetical protein